MFRKENYYSPNIFDDESAKLSKNSWWYICHANEIENNLDFLTSKVFDCDVIVQNYNNKILGFENICAHRFYRIKNEKRGNGKLKCSAHGWIYDEEGCAVGIPSRNEIFDELDKDDLSLKKIEIGFCGKFIFAKLKTKANPSLRDYLGEYFTPLENISEIITRPYFEKKYECDANWKLLYEVSLDEYHVSDIHPDTFGKLWGHFKMTDENHQYHYSEHHSSFFYNRNNLGCFFDSYLDGDNLLGKCVNGDYKIFHIFPNLTVTPFPNGVSIILIDPLSPSRSAMRVITYEYGDKEKNNVNRLEKFYDKLIGQDVYATEAQHMVLKQRWKGDILSSKEIRIKHFREVYEKLLN
jgi:phenylpropionate dioxygenase-like ring-hydroxylating dioxygenase large terminal subunit